MQLRRPVKTRGLLGSAGSKWLYGPPGDTPIP
jgi:hypothetical protein